MIKKKSALLAMATALLASLSPAQAAPDPTDTQAVDPEPVQVMILGLYHFANPGQDLVNSEVDDMLAPKRQAEIQALVKSLARWKPTKIAVENEASAPAFEMEQYASADELMTTSRNETVQIGYRLGRMLGHEAVFGYDERGGEGEPDYFPVGKVQAFAKANGQMPIIESLFADVREISGNEDDKRATQSVAASLLVHNDGTILAERHDKIYYSLIRIGDGDQQPGAELNAYWYMRNAKMFGKIDMISSPGDRVLVIAGSGHATWLRHFAERMPGYELVETRPYLIDADKASATKGG